MRFVQTPLPGAWVVELDGLADERGWFGRTFDADDFAAGGSNVVGVFEH
jgi:dTDP-4-dehydrorhamnose 3,5-epimerase-like enzyme